MFTLKKAHDSIEERQGSFRHFEQHSCQKADRTLEYKMKYL